MLNKTITISFPIKESFLFSLKEDREQFTQDLRFLSALMLYRKRRLSLGKAAELAGFSKLDFIEKLKMEQEAIFDYNEAEMDEIFADVQKMP